VAKIDRYIKEKKKSTMEKMAVRPAIDDIREIITRKRGNINQNEKKGNEQSSVERRRMRRKPEERRKKKERRGKS